MLPGWCGAGVRRQQQSEGPDWKREGTTTLYPGQQCWRPRWVHRRLRCLGRANTRVAGRHVEQSHLQPRRIVYSMCQTSLRHGRRQEVCCGKWCSVALVLAVCVLGMCG
ncbi:hypothetical protein IG631_07598 [Alternaria alternata]|jgi:hypothetical protein|nr:hypothetical protein IG631_07598 [Alternaria alternata]